MILLQEYDLEFMPIHTIKDHGLCQLTTKAIDSREEDSSGWEWEIKMYNVEKFPPTSTTTSWYADIRKYLEHDTLLLTYRSNKRGKYDLKIYLTNLYMVLFFRSTIVVSYSDF